MAQVPQDPFIVKENVILDNRRDTWFEENWKQWLGGLVAIVVGFAWMMIRTHAHADREPVLPDRPLTKDDLPLIQKKIKCLREDAETAGSVFPHLRNKDEMKAALRASEEVYLTPDVFPAAEQLHRVESARLIQISPELAGTLEAREKYEEGRYAIANDSAITDKAAANDALKKRTDPAAIGSGYSKTDDQISALRADLVGDPEFDQAQQAFHNAFETAILKRHPELTAFYHEFDDRDQAYHFFMAQANDLARKEKELEGVSVPSTQPVASDSTTRHGVRVGDTVDISALNPVVASRHAVVTAMNNDQLTIRVGSDTFTIRWENVDRIKAESK